MTARGRIIRIHDDGTAEVLITPASGPAGSRGNACGQACGDACTAYSNCQEISTVTTMADNPENIPLRPGDMVTLETPDKHILFLSFYAYIVPIALFLGLYLILAPKYGEATGLLTGGTAVCVKVALDILISRLIKTRRATASLRRVRIRGRA